MNNDLQQFLKEIGDINRLTKLDKFQVAVYFLTESQSQTAAKIVDIKNFYRKAGLILPTNFGGEIKQLLKAKKIAKARGGYYLRSVAKEKLHRIFSDPRNKGNKQVSLIDFPGLHPKITAKCKKLFIDGSYPEAVEKSFKVVRDRLRELTAYEKGSEAFGKGHIYIQGASAKNVDSDFQEGTKFLTMAIDMFRNEKSHTSDGNIKNPQLALEYLHMSSLAMNLLDRAIIK